MVNKNYDTIRCYKKKRIFFFEVMQRGNIRNNSGQSIFIIWTDPMKTSTPRVFSYCVNLRRPSWIFISHITLFSRLWAISLNLILRTLVQSNNLCSSPCRTSVRICVVWPADCNAQFSLCVLYRHANSDKRGNVCEFYIEVVQQMK